MYSTLYQPQAPALGMTPLAFHGHMRPVMAIKWTREGDYIFSAGKDGQICLWRTSDGERMGTYGVPESQNRHSAVLDLDVNNSSTLLASAGMDFKTILWDVQSGKPLKRIENKAPCRCVGFSHDDQFMFSVTDGKMGEKPSLHLFSLPDSLGVSSQDNIGYAPESTYTTAEQIMSAAWGPTNDTIYFCSDDGSVSIFDVERQKEVCTAMSLHTEEARRIRFDSNYYTLMSCSKDKTAKLLDARNLNKISTFEAEMPVNDASISPTADHVIIGGGTEAQDVTTTNDGGSTFPVKFFHKVHEEYLGQVQAHFGTINCVAFHPSGKGFASGAVDGFVKIHMFDKPYYTSPGSQPLWKPSADEDDEEDYEEDDYEEGAPMDD